MKLIIHTDGGSRGNPGQGAVGIVIEKQTDKDEVKTVAAYGKRIGVCTNNEAEYKAVIEALTQVKLMDLKPNAIDFVLDSLLVVNQLSGTYKIKKPHLRQLLFAIRSLESHIGASATYTAVPREQNSQADKLLNQALDTI